MMRNWRTNSQGGGVRREVGRREGIGVIGEI
jgi:hypothetical protein